jgi:hypothetical protein
MSEPTTSEAVVSASIPRRRIGNWRRARGDLRWHHAFPEHRPVASRQPRLPSVGRILGRVRRGSSACDNLSLDLRLRRKLHHRATRTQSAHAARHGARHSWPGRQHSWRCSDLERRARLRSSLVSHCAGRAGTSHRMDRRQNPPRATRPAIGSLTSGRGQFPTTRPHLQMKLFTLSGFRRP